MMRKRIVLISAFLALLLSACGLQPTEDAANTALDASTTVLQSETTELSEESASSTSEVSSEEIKKSVPWYVEKNISFTNEKVFQMPYYSYISFAENVTNTEFECDQNIATYTIEDIQVDESDDCLTYTLVYKVQFHWRGIFSNEVVAGDFCPNFIYQAIYPIDKYTGEIYPQKRILTVIDKGVFTGEELSHSIMWDGNNYDISFHLSEEGKELSYFYTNYDSKRNLYEDELVFEHTIVVKAPKDYDGLIFLLRKNGVTEYHEIPEEVPPHFIAESEGEEISDIAYFFNPTETEHTTEDHDSGNITSKKELSELPSDNMTILSVSSWINDMNLENGILTVDASLFMDATDSANSKDIEGMNTLSIAVHDSVDYSIYYVKSDSSGPIEPTSCSFEELKKELKNHEAANLRIYVKNGKASQVSISIRE